MKNSANGKIRVTHKNRLVKRCLNDLFGDVRKIR